MNIIKGIGFQIKKDKLIIPLFIVLFIINLYKIIGCNSGSEYVINNATLINTSVYNLFLIYVVKICGYGQKDKTINYEIMTGHPRLSIYLGRLVVSGIFAYVGGLVILFLPTVITTLIKGWGNQAVFSDILIRFGLINVTLFRLFGLAVLLTFICKTAFAAYFVTEIIGLVCVGLSSIITYIFEKNVFLISANSVLQKLTTFSDSKLVYIDGQDMMVCDASVSMESISIIIASSVILGIIYLLSGYCVFKKREN